MLFPLEELLVLALLLLGVLGIYYALKLHYIFAFALVQKTDISVKKKEKIEKIKKYIFIFLKVLLFFGLIAMSVFSIAVLMDGMSLKGLVIDLWQKIPEGFWLSLVWTLTRIGVLIVLMRYVLKMIYHFLDKQETKSIKKKRYNTQHIKRVYLCIHNSIKYTVVLGVIYRIMHFFPFLDEVSHLFLIALMLFVCIALAITVKEVFLMLQTAKISNKR